MSRLFAAYPRPNIGKQEARKLEKRLVLARTCVSLPCGLPIILHQEAPLGSGSLSRVRVRVACVVAQQNRLTPSGVDPTGYWNPSALCDVCNRDTPTPPPTPTQISPSQGWLSQQCPALRIGRTGLGSSLVLMSSL